MYSAASSRVLARSGMESFYREFHPIEKAKRRAQSTRCLVLLLWCGGIPANIGAVRRRRVRIDLVTRARDVPEEESDQDQGAKKEADPAQFVFPALVGIID